MTSTPSVPPHAPLVSVVMPFRNAGATMDRAIRSLLDQSLRSWELLAIDDRSTDDGPFAIEASQANDPRIRLLSPERPGLVAALQFGCDAARGELIARLDADDECHPDRLARQAGFLRTHPEIGVVGSLVEFGGDPVSAAGYAEHVAWANSILDHQSIVTSRFVDSPLPHPSVMFRRELLERFGGYREGPFPEDHELWLRWIDAGVRFAKVPEVLLRWNDPPDRLSRIDPRYSIEAIARLRCRHVALHLTTRGEHRPLWLWGAGRITRRRFDDLAEHGLSIAGFIDIDPDRVGQRSLGVPIVGPDHLPSIETSFIVSGVGVRGAREEIRRTLLRSGRREGEDFLIAG
jgi:glycosyltransferase involved in cell wall biosynthesis